MHGVSPDEPLRFTQGDTWTFDVYLEDVEPLGGGTPQPFDLSNCTVDLAVQVRGGITPIQLSYVIAPSANAVAGLARLLVPAANTQLATPGRALVQVRARRPGATVYAATIEHTPILIRKSLLPPAV